MKEDQILKNIKKLKRRRMLSEAAFTKAGKRFYKTQTLLEKKERELQNKCPRKKRHSETGFCNICGWFNDEQKHFSSG